MYGELTEFISFVFSLMCVFVLIMLLISIKDVKTSDEYETYEIESIREYSGVYGRKQIRVEYDGIEKSFNAIDINIGDTTHIRKYDTFFCSVQLYLSPDDYNKYVGQYESFESLQGE